MCSTPQYCLLRFENHEIQSVVVIDRNRYSRFETSNHATMAHMSSDVEQQTKSRFHLKLWVSDRSKVQKGFEMHLLVHFLRKKHIPKRLEIVDQNVLSFGVEAFNRETERYFGCIEHKRPDFAARTCTMHTALTHVLYPQLRSVSTYVCTKSAE